MIELEEVAFRYDGSHENSLNRITLKVKRGTCVVLTGKSGCGKTSVTRLVNGLIPSFYPGVLSGRITIDGKDITGYNPHMLCQLIGSVFQNPRTQFFNTDTDSELVFGMENCGVDYDEMHRRYNSTVKVMNLEELCHRDIFALSGGEKQRIAFGSVYALAPEIYVLDEPSANLDAAMVEQLKRVLLILKKKNKTILIAEHRLSYLAGIADHIMHMEGGRIVNDWSSQALYAMRVHEIAALGLRALTEASGKVEKKVLLRGSPVLKLEAVSAAYKGTGTVFRDISFSVHAGEIVGITGANGFGKSTLARIICGLHREKSGRILFGGQEVKVKQRSQWAYLVMQDPNYQLFCESVEAELRLGMVETKEKAEKISELLGMLDLEHVRSHHPLALSGGQKQRLCIALAALNSARIIIFDEPTSGLDYANMCNVASVIQMLAQKGKTILLVTHDNELISTVCTSVIMLEKDNYVNVESEEPTYE